MNLAEYMILAFGSLFASRIMGLLLAAVAIQFMLNAIRDLRGVVFS
jgi:small neutral amino acid transporter SnatA (MarC family)